MKYQVVTLRVEAKIMFMTHNSTLSNIDEHP